MGESATVPTMGTGPLELGIVQPPTSIARFLPSLSRIRRGLDKSKENTETLRAAHSTLGCKFDYKIGDTVQFRGTGFRMCIGTIIDIDDHTYKIGYTAVHE